MGAEGSAERQCAEGLRARRGPLQAEAATDPGASEALALACAESPAGLDALAALGRLRTAEEQLKGSDPAALAELRRQLSAHLPAEMR